MSGIMSLARYKVLQPSTVLTDVQIRTALNVAQSIAESLSGLSFGSEVSAVANPSGTTYRLTVHGGFYEVGQQVRLVGGGVASTLFTIADMAASSAAVTIDVVSATAIAPTKVLPAFIEVGKTIGQKWHAQRRPIYSVSEVKVKGNELALWSDANAVQTLLTTQYEVRERAGIRSEVFLEDSVIPRTLEGGEYLVKRYVRKAIDGIQVTYVAGFYSMVPADLESAVLQLVPAISGAHERGLFASESHDYYSYQTLTFDQMGALPYAAIQVLRNYARR